MAVGQGVLLNGQAVEELAAAQPNEEWMGQTVATGQQALSYAKRSHLSTVVGRIWDVGLELDVAVDRGRDAGVKLFAWLGFTCCRTYPRTCKHVSIQPVLFPPRPG